ncbi:hypothetical protein BDY19DRAFT_913372 [Irpex rosettiformis]|uniref:Uncharacterized protein n=1 Tax=Irpex rosettiformis TaxID=378272 RepID=A0ACB8UJE3_9APHY|nr:hypothetical protein BDY19DRAFT_913372 [Irpex rosettiformis]
MLDITIAVVAPPVHGGSHHLALGAVPTHCHPDRRAALPRIVYMWLACRVLDRERLARHRPSSRETLKARSTDQALRHVLGHGASKLLRGGRSRSRHSLPFWASVVHIYRHDRAHTPEITHRDAHKWLLYPSIFHQPAFNTLSHHFHLCLAVATASMTQSNPLKIDGHRKAQPI